MKKVLLLLSIWGSVYELHAQKIINVAIPPATIQWQYSVLNTGKYGIKNTSILCLEPFFVEILHIGYWGFQASLSNQTFNTAVKGSKFLLNDAVNLVDGEIIKAGPFETDLFSVAHKFKLGKEQNILFNFTVVRTFEISKLTFVYGLGTNLRLHDNYNTNKLNVITNDTAINNYFYDLKRDLSKLGFSGKVGCNINLSKHLVLTGNVVFNANRIARQDVYLYYKLENGNRGWIKIYDTTFGGVSAAVGGQLLLKYSFEYKKHVAGKSAKEKTNKFLFGY